MESDKLKLNYSKPKLCRSKEDWYAYFYYTNPQSGKREIYKKRDRINYIKDKRHKAAAGRIIVETLHKLLIEGWSPIELPEMTQPVKKVMTTLLETKKATLRCRTWQSYEYSMNTFFKWMEKEKMIDYRPDNITKKIALKYCDYLAGTKKYKGKTFNGHKANLGTMFNLMVERELCKGNPFSKIAKQQEEDGSHLAFNATQKEDLKKHLQENNPGLLLFVKFIYHCFIRPIELLRIKVSDVDLDQKVIIVYGHAGKNKRTMPVAIPDSFINELRVIDWSQYSPTDYLFGHNSIRGPVPELKPGPAPISRNSLSLYHSNVLKELKFPSGYTMYGWKHTGNVDAYNAGVDIYSLMRQNRHHSLEQTFKYLRALGLSPNVEFATKKPAL